MKKDHVQYGLYGFGILLGFLLGIALCQAAAAFQDSAQAEVWLISFLSLLFLVVLLFELRRKGR